MSASSLLLSGRSLTNQFHRHNNKPIDLSRTIRLSNLTPGAKLELVQLSKSAGVVSVALQLPPSEAGSQSNSRLTDKFPSTTTLWLLLRKFEAGVAGGQLKRNLTARGVPKTGAGSSGAGRLYYEQPVLNVMGRDLATFTDLQKTLAQLGLNSGNVLVKLSFKPSDTPLEEAMTQIQGYFDSIQEPQVEAPSSSSKKVEPEKVEPEWLEDEQTQTQPVPDPAAGETATNSGLNQSQSQTTEPAPTAMLSDRPISVFRPPTSSSSAPVAHNEADYVPTVEHAQAHQKLLQAESRNKRLPTDAELAAQQKEQAEKLAQIAFVEIKIRLPDQSSFSGKFMQSDTGASLYNFVREVLKPELRTEGFVLRNPGVRGKDEIVPDDDQKKLIVNLGLKGRVLVVFGWDEKSASPQARATKDVMRNELKATARDYTPPEVAGVVGEDGADKGLKVNIAPKPSDSGGDGDKKGKMPKWLKGLGKK